VLLLDRFLGIGGESALFFTGVLIVALLGGIAPAALSALLSGPCLVLDTVEGVAPGAVISVPLAELLTGGSPNLRSSHAIAMPLVVRLAAAVGAPLAAGTFLGIGGSAYHAAGPLSRDVDAALDGYVAAIVTHLRPGTPARRASRRRRPAAKPLRG